VQLCLLKVQFFSLVSEREKSLIQKRSELRIVEEEYTRSKKELERQRKEAVADTSTKRSESENGEEYRVGVLSLFLASEFNCYLETSLMHDMLPKFPERHHHKMLTQ
jgi:E3 ubiquitin-protein ligase BRE1